MLLEFATWYGQQMVGLFPSLDATRGARADGLVVDVERLGVAPATARLSLRRRSAETPIGRFVLDAQGMAAARASVDARRGRGRAAAPIVRLPAGAVLERVVTLPLAAEISLERVVSFELDRYTPFAADEVFWAVQVRARDRLQGKLRAAITLVPRAPLRPLLEALGAMALDPAMLEGEAAGGGVRALPIGQRDARRDRRQRRAVVAASIVCGALLLAVVVVPFLRLAWAGDAVEARIAALQPQLTEAEALRQRLSAQAAGSDAIAAEQAQVGIPLQAIAALTQILPDDTFLTTLVLQKRQVTLEGQSANAARLIGSLSADPVIRNAAFAAPVTRNESGADLFSIRAEVRP